MSARGSADARVARRAAPGRAAARPRVPAGSRDPGRTLVPVVAIALLTGLAAAAFWPVYRDASFVRMAAVTLVVGALVVQRLVAQVDDEEAGTPKGCRPLHLDRSIDSTTPGCHEHVRPGAP